MSTRICDGERLVGLIRAGHSCIRICTSEEDDALRFVGDAAMGVGRGLRCWSVVRGVYDGMLEGSPAESDSENPIMGLHRLLAHVDRDVLLTLDMCDHLGDPRVLRMLRESMSRVDGAGGCLVLVDHGASMPDSVRAHTTPFELSLPDEEEIEAIVRGQLRRAHADRPIEIELRRSHLDAIIRNLRGMNRRQVAQIIREVLADHRFDGDDLDAVLARKREILSHGGLLEFVQTPVDMSEVGGIRRLRRWLADREYALSQKGEAFGLAPPRGVLMLGVQGAGKSLCAKAIATAWKRPLLKMDVGALYDRYVGESERRLRDALGQAEMMAPVVLWIDEIEKAFASAAAQSTDGGLSKRMFGTLLTWMQDHRSPVFLVATANDIEALPPELMRKGRFDEIFFVDLPGEEARRQIIRIHLRKRERDVEEFDVEELVAASEGFSGAEIEQAIVSALHEAFSGGGVLTTGGVVAAMRASPPLSVTMREKIERLRAWAKGRCVVAD